MISYREILNVLGLISVLLLIQNGNISGNAYEFKVGGSGYWAFTNDPNVSSYNEWAERTRFLIGDTLLFVYPASQDSVLYVTKEDYNNCNTESPLQKYTDGHTIFKFNQSGPHYFISGVKDNCLKNEKLTLIVMADRNNQTISSPPPPPPPLTPPPSVDEPPSPPPTGSVDIIPTSAPSQETTPPPPPSGGALIVMSFIGSIGAFIASSLLLFL